MFARLGLAAVFIVAGLAKLLDRPGSRRALADFGVPDRVTGPLIVILPIAELTTATALLFASTALWGAGAALLLLAVLTLGLARALRRGETPDCHCFGQIHSQPVSWLTVARNTGLTLPAAYLVAGGPGPSLLAWVHRHDAQELSLIATSTLAVVTTASSAALWRQNRRLRSTQAPMPPVPLRIGARAPRFSLPSVDGDVVTLHELLAHDRPCLLVFVAPRCAPCTTLLPEIARWQDTLADRLALVVVSAGDAEEAGALVRQHGLAQVLADAESTVSHAYAVPGTPCALLVAADGTLRSAPAAGQVAIEALLRIALQGESQPALTVHHVA